MIKNNKCWKIKNCPASHYLICPAYAVEKNCWEVPGTRCSESHDHKQCGRCEVYILHKEEIEAAADPDEL